MGRSAVAGDEVIFPLYSVHWFLHCAFNLIADNALRQLLQRVFVNVL